jgi:hypothetical protein
VEQLYFICQQQRFSHSKPGDRQCDRPGLGPMRGRRMSLFHGDNDGPTSKHQLVDTLTVAAQIQHPSAVKPEMGVKELTADARGKISETRRFQVGLSVQDQKNQPFGVSLCERESLVEQERGLGLPQLGLDLASACHLQAGLGNASGCTSELREQYEGVASIPFNTAPHNINLPPMRRDLVVTKVVRRIS